MDLLSQLLETPSFNKLFSTALLLVVVMLGYRFAHAGIRRGEWPNPDTRRRWLVMARNTAILVFLLALVVIWAAQLRTVALSVVGFAMAIVLTLKELIMCVTGGFLRSSAGIFRVGDRIEVKGMRGEVIDMTMLTTTVLEIGPGPHAHQYSGRSVMLPNAVFLNEPLVNESYTQDYVLHTTKVPLAAGDDWQRAERELLAAASEVCAPCLEPARKHIERLGRRECIDVPSLEPRVLVQLPEAGKVDLVLRFPAPARRKGHTEQAILRRYLERNRTPADAPAKAVP